MSEAVSDWSSADEQDRLARKAELAKLAHRTAAEVKDMEIKLLEYIPLGWRSGQVSPRSTRRKPPDSP